MRIFYSATKKHELVDSQGKYDLTTVQDILPADKKSADYQMVDLGPDEAQRFDQSGNLTKFNVRLEVEAANQARQEKETAGKIEVAAELKKLGVSDKAISSLTGIPEDSFSVGAVKTTKL